MLIIDLATDLFSISLSNPVQHKAVVKRYMESLLAKINKLRALIKDLKKNYSAECAGKLWCIHVVYTQPKENVKSCGCALQLHMGILKATYCIPRPVKTLEDNITKIDEKYEALNEHMATGETDGYSKESCAQETYHSNTSQDCSSWHLRICRAQVVECCRAEDEGSYHGVRLSNLLNNFYSITVCILFQFSPQCYMFGAFFDEHLP